MKRQEAYKTSANRASEPELAKEKPKEHKAAEKSKSNDVEEDVGPAIPAGFVMPSFPDKAKKSSGSA